MEGWVRKQRKDSTADDPFGKVWLQLDTSVKSNIQLTYKEKPTGPVKRTISLGHGARVMSWSMIDAVSVWPNQKPNFPKSSPKDRRFAVTNEKRTFFLLTETADEAESWIQAIRPLTDVAPDRYQEVQENDEFIQLVEAEETTNTDEERLDLALKSELILDPNDGGPPIDENSPAVDQSFLDKVIQEIKDLGDVFKVAGFELADWGYIGLSIGTAVGISIALQRDSDGPLSHEKIDASGKSKVQRSVLAMLGKSRAIATELEEQLLQVNRITFNLSGFGFAIPSVTASLSFGDSTVSKDEIEAAKKKKSDNASSASSSSPKKHHGMFQRMIHAVGRTAGTITSVVTKPFRSASQSALQKIVEEVKDLREALCKSGLTLENNYLSVTIGTFVGVGITVIPLKNAAAAEQKAGNFSLLQRIILAALVQSYKVAQKATALDVIRVSLSFSGIGLAIPFVSTTAFLGQLDETTEVSIENLATMLKESVDADPNDSEAQLDEAADKIKQEEKEDEVAITADSNGEETPDRKTNFILESVTSAKKATTSAVGFVGRATIKAVYATGDAAEEVLSALYNAAAAPVKLLGKAMPGMQSTMQDNLVKAKGVTDSLPLKVGNPSLSLSYGTQFGASVRFEENRDVRGQHTMEEMTTAEIDAIDDSDSGTIGRVLKKILKKAHESNAVMSEIQKEHARIDLIGVSLSGLGLGIPVASGFLYIGKTPDES